MRKIDKSAKAPKVTLNPARERGADPAPARAPRRSRKGAEEQAPLPLGDAAAQPTATPEADPAQLRGELAQAQQEQTRLQAEHAGQLAEARRLTQEAEAARDQARAELAAAQRRAVELDEQLRLQAGEMTEWRERAHRAEAALQVVASGGPTAPRTARPKVSPSSAADPALAEKRRAAARAAVATRRQRAEDARAASQTAAA